MKNTFSIIFFFMFFLGCSSSLCIKAPNERICEIEQAILQKTNEQRKGRDLQNHPSLGFVARKWSSAMLEKGILSHDGFPHERQAAYLLEFGSKNRPFFRAENVAMFTIPKEMTAEEVAEKFLKLWMGSPGHRQNILDSTALYLGVGVVQQGNTYYATQIFGAKGEAIQDEE